MVYELIENDSSALLVVPPLNPSIIAESVAAIFLFAGFRCRDSPFLLQLPYSFVSIVTSGH
jgi:hypothetical protein